MLSKIEQIFISKGKYEQYFMKYLESGWIYTDKNDCSNIESYNPHTGKGKGTDGAAHCRSICLMKFIKNS
jgi:hypothetical protein